MANLGNAPLTGTGWGQFYQQAATSQNLVDPALLTALAFSETVGQTFNGVSLGISAVQHTPGAIGTYANGRFEYYPNAQVAATALQQLMARGNGPAGPGQYNTFARQLYGTDGSNLLRSNPGAALRVLHYGSYAACTPAMIEGRAPPQGECTSQLHWPDSIMGNVRQVIAQFGNPSTISQLPPIDITPPGVIDPPNTDPPTEGVVPGAGSIGDALGSGFGSALSGLAQNTIGQGGIINRKLPEILLAITGITLLLIALGGFAVQQFIKVKAAPLNLAVGPGAPAPKAANPKVAA